MSGCGGYMTTGSHIVGQTTVAGAGSRMLFHVFVLLQEIQLYRVFFKCLVNQWPE